MLRRSRRLKESTQALLCGRKRNEKRQGQGKKKKTKTNVKEENI